MTELLALYREAEFSPGQHKSNDSRLLELLADRLRDDGFAVQLATFDQAPLLIPNVDTVLSMCQGKAALEQLTVWENQGKQIINRPQAARNTYRDRLSEVMVGAGVSFAGTELISTNGEKPHRGLTVEGSVWLKRGDVHASIPADVQRIEAQSGLEAGLADYAHRGIRSAAVQLHYDGDEIKFYGVAQNFFHWFYSAEARGYHFDMHHLRRLANEAAVAAGLDIFGGDIIVSPGGELTLIDLNDWPSFAPCLGPASEAIAEFVKARVR